MKVNRRNLLAAAAGGCAALSPLMSSLAAAVESRADATTKRPLRFVFCIKSNGLWAEMIQPQGMNDRLPFKVEYDDHGRLIDSNNGNIRKQRTPPANLQMPADWKVSEVMAPLQPFADRMSILQGIDSGFSVYHKAGYQTLGAFAARRRDTDEVAGVTVDSLLARSNPAPISHVCLGHDPRSPSGVAYVPTSAEAKNKPIAFFTKPKRAYKELFGVIDDGAARNAYDVQTDILDFFAEDTQRIRRQVAGPEREQLDRYLGAFDSIRESRKKVEAIRDQLKEFAPERPSDIEANSTMLIGAGNTDIAIASLLSGLTNVVTLRFDLLGSTSYEGIGGLHGGVGHGQVKDILAARRKITGFHFEQVGRIAEALAAIPEGEGTMLDNTVIVYTSDNGETHHSSGVNYPILLLGDLGGRLARRRYFAPEKLQKGQGDRSKPGYTRLGDVWATLLAAAGAPVEGFGIPANGVAHTPIEPLLG